MKQVTLIAFLALNLYHPNVKYIAAKCIEYHPYICTPKFVKGYFEAARQKEWDLAEDYYRMFLKYSVPDPMKEPLVEV